MINFPISFSLERSRLIEKYFVSFTEHEEALALINFQLNLSFKEDLVDRKKSVEVTLHLDSKPISFFFHMGDFLTWLRNGFHNLTSIRKEYQYSIRSRKYIKLYWSETLSQPT